MHLTPHRIAAIYALLRTLPPFSRWQLPAAGDVEFRARRRRDIYGEHTYWRKRGHALTVSTERNSHLQTVIATLVHEMIHMAQQEAGELHGDGHGAHFDKRARAVGRALGMDWRAI